MAITTTNARYEGFIFDGENSRTYGVYVTDVEVFGAPVRNVEMISIPGRNGAFALDKGSYENIEVTYHCAMGCESQADFNAGISAFRNMLASRTGYKRLEDEINTSEYRMACFRGGISVPTLNKETATFDVVFDCKPQRYLKSGETAVSVASGGTIMNPTLLESSPLIVAEGYGTIGIEGQEIEIENVVVGDVLLSNRTTEGSVMFNANNLALLETGDTITVAGGSFYFLVDSPNVVSAVSGTISGDISGTVKASYSSLYDGFLVTASLTSYDLIYRTATTKRVTINLTVTHSGGTSNGTVSFDIAYTGYDYLSISDPQISVPSSWNVGNFSNSIGAATGHSTRRTLTDTIYIDLDIGEAYIYQGATLSSVNNIVTIPAKLPVLVPGENTITYDNTITQFQIVPRWWQL